MDVGVRLKKENPLSKANIFSKLFFGWMIKLCYKGTQKDLEVSDLYKTLQKDRSDQLGSKLEQNWIKEVKKSKENDKDPSLFKVIIKTFMGSYLFYGIFLFIQNIALRSLQPLVLSYLIAQFGNQNGDNLMEMYISASVLVGMSIILIFSMHHINFGLCSIGMRVRISISSLIYRKIMKLNRNSLGQTATGQVVNLLSNDVNRFDMVVVFLHYLWIMPFQVVLVSYFIWQEVGVSCLAGILSMALLTLPVQSYLGKLTSKYRLQVAQRTDSRVKLMSEVIAGIQVIKMYAWEKPFEKVIKLARCREINVLTKASYLRGVYLSCMVFIERTTLFLTVTSYVLLGNTITADKVFSMAQFFNILQLAMAIYYPMAISLGAESLVSIKRLQNFLDMDEKEESNIEVGTDKAIKLENVSAGWIKNSSNLTLDSINLNLPAGSLCAVVGPVGAGKSSFLQLLIGELPPSNGNIKVGGEVAYSSQEPWLFASTVRKNILFGQEFDRLRYKAVVKVCALEKDFEQFPQGDRTIVGERGVSLSGGQRARINLARAIYRQADIYLLDDPLSAVDTHVGRHLFDKCIYEYLKSKTRVLVTHQLQYLKKADLIIVLNEGKIEAKGTFEELSNSNLDFTKLLISADEVTTENKEGSVEVIHKRKDSIRSYSSDLLESTNDDLEKDEEVITHIKSPFWEYLNSAGNKCLVALVILILVMGQTACSAADYWVAFWTEQEAIRHSNETILRSEKPLAKTVDVYKNDNGSWVPSFSYSKNVTFNFKDNETNYMNFMVDEVEVNNESRRIIKSHMAMYVYTILIIAAISITLLRSFLFFKTAMKCSKNLHTRMFHALLQAPMRFFDTNPSGRVLNRFSKDMGSIDETLPRTLLEATQIILVMSGILINVSLSNYYSIIAIIIFGIIFIKVRNLYIATAKDVKHLEGITKSPVFSHINSTLNGLSTIRASKAEESLICEFDDHQDLHTSSWFLIIACIDSFGLWLDIICVFFVATVTFSFIILHQYGHVSGSLVGLAISQSLILTGMLQYGMRQSAEVINQLTSVERVLHYTTLETESPFETPPDRLPIMPWPSSGLIEFRNLYLRYSPDDPPVLKGLNFTIHPGEKVGIVGRTGAGKSSLISALFRLAPLEGSILIDYIDTKTLGLNDLRKRIAIIPQEPVLFSATLRYNLDPFDEFDDKRLWNALEEVELKDSVDSLDMYVSGGGSNFSLGQRQLLCLARAILRNNKILVLDEATANVDPRTDSLIQATIRRKFASCTVLTIAHRLNTIMDSDKVLVMEFGRMVEYDHPHTLLQNSEGHFTKMVQETGPSMTLQLKDIAFEAFKSKSQ